MPTDQEFADLAKRVDALEPKVEETYNNHVKLQQRIKTCEDRADAAGRPAIDAPAPGAKPVVAVSA